MSKTFKQAFIITGDASGGVKAVKATRVQIDALTRSVATSGSSVDAYTKSFSRSNKTLSSFASQAKTALGIFSGVVFAREALKMADSAKQMTARLQLATDSTYELAVAQTEIARISRDTYSSLETNVTLYSRMEIATKDLGLSQDTLLIASEALQNSFRAYGTSSDEAASATLQLTQALAKGKLDGDEFRSVMENAPLVMQALQKELQITKKELFEFSRSGKLGVEDLVNALSNSAAEFAEKSAQVPVKISEAMIKGRNSITKYVGEIDKAYSITNTLSQGIILFTDNIDTAAKVIGGAVAIKLLSPTLNKITASAVATNLSIQRFGIGLVAVNFKAAALTGSLNLLKSGMALLGGPAGIAIIASYGIYELITSLEVSEERFTELTYKSKEAGEAILAVLNLVSENKHPEAITAIGAALDKEIAKLKEFEEELSKIGQNNFFTQRDGTAVLSRSDIEETQRAQESIDQLNKQIAEMQKLMELASQDTGELAATTKLLSEAYQDAGRFINIFGLALPGVITNEQLLANQTRENTEAVDDWIESSEKQLEKLVRQNEVFGLSAVEIIELDALKQRSITTDAALLNSINHVTSALISETIEHENSAAAVKLLATNTKLAENNLKNAKDIIKSLTAEHRPVQAMLESLAESMEAINSVPISPDFTESDLQNGMDLLQKEAEKIAKEILDEVKGVFVGIPLLFEDSIEEIKDVDFSGMFDGFAAGLNPAISALQSFKDELALISQIDLSGGEKAFYKTGITAEFALNSMANMADEGSEAQKKLQAAAAITNTILGIGAILEQGKGDPYTAFARMATMAVLVASLGVQVAGAFGGGGGGGAQRQQEIQGTGTVLGDASAKSESINNALDIIATASEKIVGINSSMLRSLNAMNNAISGTVNQIAQGGEIGDLGTTASYSFGAIFFGGSKVIDRGVQILAGGIQDAINGTLFQAYEVAKRRGLFGSSTSTGAGALDDTITSQISLIFQSMQDAILAGAEALGLNSQEVQNALDSYQIEAQRISLLDLDSDEQQAELEAVFSSIFDGLVSVSIPFITQFQQAGEGLGETLARVSTSVLVFEEAVQSMGLDFIAKELDPELFAQAAVSISDFAGGMERFIDGYTNYVSNFLSEGEQLKILGDRIGGVFDGIDLALPQAREGFVDLIQGLDLTTEAGQEAFGTLISLSSEIDSFYSNLEDLWENFFEIFYSPDELLDQSIASSSDLLGQQATDLGIDPNIGLAEFRTLFEETLPALTSTQIVQWLELGGSIGRVNELLEQQNAIEVERIRLLQEYNDFGASLQEQLNQANSSDFINSLAGIRQQEIENIATLNELAVAAGLAGASEQDLMRAHRLAQTQIEATIESLRNIIASLFDQLYSDDLDARIAELESQQTTGIDNVGSSIAGLYDSWVRVIDQLRDYTRDRLVGDLSPLEAEARLALAQENFYAAVDAANNGDLEAAQSLIGLANIVDQLNGDVNASGSDYNSIFYAIQNALDSVNIPGGLDSGSLGTYTVTPSDELQALYNEREARAIAGEAENRLALATQLAQHLNELALAINQPLFQIADELGLSMTALVTDLGVNLDDLTVASVQNLANISNLLGVELSDLAFNLGEDVALAMGNLADAQSLLNDALEGTIGNLPQEYTDLLAPLLHDVETAADGTAQEVALAALEAATSGLPIEYRNLLAPYFDSIEPVSLIEESNSYLSQTVGWLEDIRDILLNGYSNIITGPTFGPTLGDGTAPDIIPGVDTGPTLPDPEPPPIIEPIDNSSLITNIDNRSSASQDKTNEQLKIAIVEMSNKLSTMNMQLARLTRSNEDIVDNTGSIANSNKDIARKELKVGGARKSRSVF